MSYKIIGTTADFKVKGWGSTREELLSSLGLGMAVGSCGIEVSPEKARQEGREFSIAVEGFDNESLVVNFLSELIYLYNVEKVFVWSFDLKVEGFNVAGKVYGLPVEQVSAELKAATYANLKVEHKNGQWEATVVFDI